MPGVTETGGVRVLNVSSDRWEGFIPEDDSHAGQIDFRATDAGDPGSVLSKVQWLRQRAVSTRGVHLASGLYWMAPSTFDFEFPGDETIHIVEGAIDVDLEDGERVELRTGDIAYFPGGLNTTWHVIEPTLEFFTLLD